jgi:hypothetical protein
VDDYDGIYNCSDLKYGIYEISDSFLFISFDGKQNIGGKQTIVRISGTP